MKAMRIADRGNPNGWAKRPTAEHMGGRFRTALVHFSGLRRKENSRWGDFFLDFFLL
jgi:hypothetical protein